MDELSFEAIDAQLDRIQADLDEIERDMIWYRVKRDRPWLCVAPLKEAARRLIEVHVARWKEKNFKKPVPVSDRIFGEKK